MPSFQPPSRPPAPRFSSSSMDQLKAQLQVLRRPIVWGSAAVLLAAGYFLWSNPNSLNQSRRQTPARQNPLYQPQTGAPGSSGEFGNLPGLNSPTGQIGTIGQTKIPGLTPAPSAANPQFGSADPFATASPEDSSIGTSMPGSMPGSLSSSPTQSSSASSSSGLDNPGGNTDFIQGGYGRPTSRSSTSSSAVSPLQSALDRATHSTSTPSNPASSEVQPNSGLSSVTAPSAISPGSLSPSTPSSGTAPRTSSIPTASGDTSLSPIGQSAAQPSAPSTSLPATTGYTVPPAFRTPTVEPAGSSSGFSNFSRPQPLPGDYSAPLSPPYATQPMLPSSSAPGAPSSSGSRSVP